MTGKRKRKLAMPDTLIIVASVVLLVAILSWIIPSGTYDYQEMNINGRIRNVAIDGTYHTIDKSEVTTTGFLGFFSVLYRGCVEANIHVPAFANSPFIRQCFENILREMRPPML